MSERAQWVIVDWRPYDIPSVYGPYRTPLTAEQAWEQLAGDFNDEGELPDGVDIVQMGAL